MIKVSRETPRQPDVVTLIRQSDVLMQSLYPAESNHLVDIDSLAGPHVHFFVARENGRALGCGAFVLGVNRQAEMKRVFVDPAARGKGIARMIMDALEREAASLGVALIQLETGIKQPEAIALYRKFGYVERGPFGSYQPDPLSLFMEKRLASCERAPAVADTHSPHDASKLR
jgi:putative acetyltransferase